MPWTRKDAPRFTRKASSPGKAQRWAEIANTTLYKTADEGRAVRTANAAIRGPKKKDK